MHMQVAAPVRTEPRGTVALQDDALARLGAGLDGDVDRSVEGVQGRAGAERRRRHGHGDDAVQLVATAFEHGVSSHHDLDEQVACRPAVGTDLSLAGKLDPGTGVDAGRNLHGQGAPCAHPPVARAFGARVRDRRPESLALRAGSRRHHLTEEGPLHLLDLAAALAQHADLGVAARGRAGA
jgi:hypothetical protein